MKIKKESFLQKTFMRLYRIMEGLTTGSMLVAFGIRRLRSRRGVIYGSHWLCSLLFHVLPEGTNAKARWYEIDVAMIHLLIGRRLVWILPDARPHDSAPALPGANRRLSIEHGRRMHTCLVHRHPPSALRSLSCRRLCHVHPSCWCRLSHKSSLL